MHKILLTPPQTSIRKVIQELDIMVVMSILTKVKDCVNKERFRRFASVQTNGVSMFNVGLIDIPFAFHLY
jgi:hypothetical protein